MTAPDHATTDSLTAVDEQADPRLARSRNRLLDAAAPNFGGGLDVPKQAFSNKGGRLALRPAATTAAAPAFNPENLGSHAELSLPRKMIMPEHMPMPTQQA